VNGLGLPFSTTRTFGGFCKPVRYNSRTYMGAASVIGVIGEAWLRLGLRTLTSSMKRGRRDAPVTTCATAINEQFLVYVLAI
jgi:hypothetical protein